MIARMLLAILAAGFLLAGCASNFGPVVIATDSLEPGARATRIQAGDRVKVSVYGETNLTGIYDIHPAGTLSLPLAGTIRAAGMTRAELEAVITRRLGSTLNEPHVSVEILEFRPFYVMGEAEKPGQYPFRSGLNVLTAITTAGGLTYRASRSTVYIQHSGEQIWREYAMTSAVLIAPGDLIRIPERYF